MAAARFFGESPEMPVTTTSYSMASPVVGMVPTAAGKAFSLVSWQKPPVNGPIVGTMLDVPVPVVDQQNEPVL
jgi:hypothetical protein